MHNVESANPASAPRTGRWALTLLLLINLFNYIDRFVLAASLTSIGNELLKDDKHESFKKGLLALAFLVTYMLTAPIFGWLADRTSRWMLICVGVILWSLASAASGLAHSYEALFATRVFVGIGEAVYGPAAPTLLSDYFPVQRRGQIMGFFYMAIPVGSALGFALGGLMSQHLGWRWGFYSVAPPGILLGLLCLFFRDPRAAHAPVIASSLAPPAPLAKPDYSILWRTPSYVINTLGMTAMTFALGGVAWWMPDYIVKFRNYSDEGHVGITFGAITALAGISAIALGGWLGDRLRTTVRGSYFVVSAVGMVVAFPLFLLMLVSPFPWAYGLIFLAEWGLFFNIGPTNTILANVAHPSVRSTGFAINILIIHLFGDAISPALIGWLADTFPLSPGKPNLNIGFQAVSAAILLAAVFWIWGRKYLETDTARAENSPPPIRK